MRVWTAANQKGGVGKTTTVISLGSLLTLRGHRVLLVDLDPHGSLTGYFKYDSDQLTLSVYSLFQANAQKTPLDPRTLVCHTSTPHLDLLPSTLAMATLDRMAGKLEGMGLILKNTLQTLSADYDFAIIDCPPMLGVLMVNAVAASERLIIPVQTEFLAIKGLERMIQTLAMVLRARKTLDLPYTIVPTLFDRRTRAAQEGLDSLRQSHTNHLWPGFIPVDTHFREASKAGIPPPMFDPRSRGVVAYENLLANLLGEESPAVSEAPA